MTSIRVNLTAILLAGASLAWAQIVAPHTGFVYPAGGRQGTSFQVTVGGQALIGTTRAVFSGAGVEAEVLEYARPMTGVELQKLRDELAELMKKGPAATGPERERIAEIRQKIASNIRRPAQPAISETVTLKVTVAADAVPGTRDLRLVTRGGLTNPLAFQVDQLPEYARSPIRVVTEFATGLPVRFREQQPQNRAPDPPVEVTLPAVLNGQVGPGMANRYKFHALKGMRLVAETRARALIPYISDAVPGWFQAALRLSDGVGKEVAAAAGHRYRPDPVLFYEVPQDGDYTLEIRDAIYRGREDFVYRIRVGELPYLTGLFPLAGKVGARTTLELSGWNLPSPKLEVWPDAQEGLRGAGKPLPDGRGPAPSRARQQAASDRRTDGTRRHEIAAENGGLTSNHLPFLVEPVAVTPEKEPNEDQRKAQKLKLPAFVTGRIERAGEKDTFRFDGKAGQEIVAEVIARRLESPLDSAIRLLDDKGRELAANDDAEDAGAGLLTHHADSRLQFKLPRKGAYYLQVSDNERQGGPEFSYCLRVSLPRPDFELRVTPASLTLAAGGSTPLTVHALRRDGFQGEITLRLKDAPAGYGLSGGWIPAGQDQVRLTLSAPPGRAVEIVRLELEGLARIGPREVKHLAEPAEDMMQAFAYHHLAPVQEWVAGAARASIPWRIAAGEPLLLEPGKTASLRVSAPARRQAGQVEFALNAGPEGITVERVQPVTGGVEIVLKADAEKAKPGLKGNLIFDAFFLPAAQSTPAPARPRRQPLGVLPAVPFAVAKR